MSVTQDQTRKCLLPIPANRKELWKFYKLQLSLFWVAEETTFTTDIEDYRRMSPQEQHFVKNILCYFAVGDGYIIENLMEKFTSEFTSLEVVYNYNAQTLIEQVHAEVYAKIIDAIVTDPTEKSKCFAETSELPIVKMKTNWIANWMNSSRPIGERLIAFAAVEGILFSGSFCAIYWLKEKGIMPGLAHANDLIARDEGMHTDLAVLINEHLSSDERASTKIVHEIIKSAVEVEKAFIVDSLPCSMIGMNCKLMSTYIEFVADRLSVQLGHGKIYEATNPFTFMELQSVSKKSNFFEREVAEYSKANAGLAADAAEIVFDGDF